MSNPNANCLKSQFTLHTTIACLRLSNLVFFYKPNTASLTETVVFYNIIE